VELGSPSRPAEISRESLQVQLGARLFDDPLLSASGQIACQSCHNRRLGWGDGLPRPFGHDRTEGRRNAPALFTAAARPALFWDGRAGGLEEQALGPLTDPAEMANHALDDIASRLNADPDYPALFAAAYGVDRIALPEVLSALAAFQGQLDVKTRFDRFLEGDAGALSDEALRGLHLFRTKARCVNCHFGPDLTDDGFHNLGLAFFNRRLQDLGRYEVTGLPVDAGRFRTPSLRHVSGTGPYMHNGGFPSLRGVVNFYNAGGARPRARSPEEAGLPLFGPATATSELLQPLELDPDEIAALLAFLDAI